MKNHLEITIPDHNSYCTIFADGKHSWKTYDRQKKITMLYYPPGAVVFLYYTYPVHREACVIRHTGRENGVTLPGLSRKVTQLFSVKASRVDKLKRASGFLGTHSSAGAHGHDDGFYIRLCYLLEQRGKLNYTALAALAESSPKETQNFLF